MATQTNLNLAQSLYIAYYGRAADSEGLEYWADRIEAEGVGAILNAFGNSAEYQDRFSEMSNDALIENLYVQMFDRLPDIEGLQFYKGLLESGEKSLAQIAYDILAGAQEPDTTTLATKLEAANAYTASAGDDFTLEGSVAAVRDANAVAPDLTLTVGQDNLVGTDGDDVFEAPIVQNANGAVTNTLESGDVINGGEGRDTLNADLTLTSSAGIPVGPAISPTTNDVEVVNLRAQTPNSDILNNFSTIDAERMSGVEEWWSVNSRSYIQVEDVRSNPDDTAIGMRNTDPFVGYGVYFDPAQVTERRIDSTENSSLTLTLNDQDAGTELENFPVNGVVFSLGGEQFTAQSDAMGEADTYAEFVAALEAELAAQGLEAIEVTLNADNTITLTDPAGAEFEAVGYTWVDNIAPSSGDLSWNQQVGAPTEVSEEELIGTTVVLDGVGRTDQGGTLDIGSLGAGGVNVFNVLVQSDSWLTAMESRSNLGFGARNLQEVLVAEGSQGDLTVGSPDGTILIDSGQSGQQSLVPDDGRVFDGLTDVRVVDASELDGSLRAGITLTPNAVGRYLDDAEGTVDFSYTGSANDDILAFKVDDAVTADLDFAMQIDAGAGDDLVILASDFDLDNVSLNGGEGNDTLETSSDIGTDTTSIPAAFAGFENLVLTGSGTNADMAELPGVETVTIATGGTRSDNANPIFGGSSTVANLAADTELTITGERQTLGNGSNNDQSFGTITLTNAQGESQLVNLENTARVDGELTVNRLTVDGANSAVRELTLNSGGGRDTTNTVNNINAALVTSLLFTGSQDLSASVNSIGNTGADAVAFDISGADLEGSLDLTVDAQNITDSNAQNEAVTLTGTANDDDQLTLTGTGQTITSDTTVNGFETVVFGNDPFSGTVDVDNFNDVELFHLNDLDGATTLNNLSSGANVEIGSDANNAVTLNGTGVLNAEVSDTDRSAALFTEGFSTVNLDLGEGDHEHNFALNLDGDARNLVITGEDTDQATDGLDLTAALPATLAVVDVSGYAGSFTGSMADFTGTDTRFEVGAGDFDLTMSGRDFTSSLSFTMAQLSALGGSGEVEVTINGQTETVSYSFDTDIETTISNFLAVLEAQYAGVASFAVEEDSGTFTIIATDEAGAGAPVVTQVDIDSGSDGTVNLDLTDGDYDQGDAVVDYNTIFAFNEAGTVADPSIWVIDNFVAESFDDAGNANYSILDLRDLGIESFADLDFQDGVDANGDGNTGVVITAETGGVTWMIELTGVNEANLAPSENFIFA